MAQKTHDFFVFYYEEDDLAHRFVRYFVRRWESEFKLKGLFFHRDAVIGKNKFAALEDDIERSIITVIVFTKGFMSSRGGFARYASTAAFAKLLKNISTTPCYIPIGVGLKESEFPDNIRDVLSVARFEEYDWDQQVQVWRQLDNVLIENNLLTQNQINRLGSTYRRYIRPAEKLMSDKFLRDHVAACICNEFFSLGISLNIPHQRLEQIKKTDSDPFVYIFRMMVTWREECERNKLTEDKMLELLLEALTEIERLDVREKVHLHAEEFKEKRLQNREAKRRADAEEEAELVRQQRVNIQEIGDAQLYNDTTVQNGNNIVPSREEVDTVLNYVAQEENEQTSVMRMVQPAQGYVPLHGGQHRQQVVLNAGGDGQFSLIPRQSMENGEYRDKISEGAFPNSVPWWTLPVAVVTSTAVAAAVTAFICMRYKP